MAAGTAVHQALEAEVSEARILGQGGGLVSCIGDLYRATALLLACSKAALLPPVWLQVGPPGTAQALDSLILLQGISASTPPAICMLASGLAALHDSGRVMPKGVRFDSKWARTAQSDKTSPLMTCCKQAITIAAGCRAGDTDPGGCLGPALPQCAELSQAAE